MNAAIEYNKICWSENHNIAKILIIIWRTKTLSCLWPKWRDPTKFPCTDRDWGGADPVWTTNMANNVLVDFVDTKWHWPSIKSLPAYTNLWPKQIVLYKLAARSVSQVFTQCMVCICVALHTASVQNWHFEELKLISLSLSWHQPGLQSLQC